MYAQFTVCLISMDLFSIIDKVISTFRQKIKYIG